MGKVFVGHDWAEAHHDVHVEDERRAAAWPRPGCPRGSRASPASTSWWRRFVEDPAEVVIATETDRGLFVGALVAAGYTVLAVNPMSTSRYRERHSTSGAKSDPGDARVLAELARTDGHNHRPDRRRQRAGRGGQGPGPGPSVDDLDPPAPDQPAALDAAGVLPGRSDAFDDLASGDALAVLAVAPTPALGRGLSRSKIAAALRRGGRQRRVEERAAEIQAALRTDQLAAPDARLRGHGRDRGRPGRGRSPSSPPRSPASRPSWPTVLSSTRTPRSSAPCQDWG